MFQGGASIAGCSALLTYAAGAILPFVDPGLGKTPMGGALIAQAKTAQRRHAVARSRAG